MYDWRERVCELCDDILGCDVFVDATSIRVFSNDALVLYLEAGSESQRAVVVANTMAVQGDVSIASWSSGSRLSARQVLDAFVELRDSCEAVGNGIR